MKLIGNYTSPYVRKISVILLEKGIVFEFVNESPWHENSHVPDYTPLGKIPALVTAEDGVWYNSSLIAAYLELSGHTPAFLPADPRAALEVRRLETLADGICDAALLILREQQKVPEQQSTSEVLRQHKKIQRGLDALEVAAGEGKWLNAGQITLADIAATCMLSYLDFRHVVPNWGRDRPVLIRLAEKMLQRDSFVRTVPSSV